MKAVAWAMATRLTSSSGKLSGGKPSQGVRHIPAFLGHVFRFIGSGRELVDITWTAACENPFRVDAFHTQEGYEPVRRDFSEPPCIGNG